MMLFLLTRDGFSIGGGAALLDCVFLLSFIETQLNSTIN